MKIVEARIDESVLPKKDKEWKFALAASGVTEGWIVIISGEDGTLGYGYAASMNHYGAPHEAVECVSAERHRPRNAPTVEILMRRIALSALLCATTFHSSAAQTRPPLKDAVEQIKVEVFTLLARQGVM